MLTSKCLEEFQSRRAELRLEDLSPVVDGRVGGEEKRREAEEVYQRVWIFLESTTHRGALKVRSRILKSIQE